MADVTWREGAGSGDYNTGANWSGSAVPGEADHALFGQSDLTDISFSQSFTRVHSWVFTEDAANYTFTVGTGQLFDFLRGGIVVEGGSVNIVNDENIRFFVGATAGSASIENNRFVEFKDGATAGEAQFSNHFFLSFTEDSTAGDATITNDTASSRTFFQNESSGGNAALTNQHASGQITFEGESTGGDATIANAGTLTFRENSKGGRANITNDKNARFVDDSTAGEAIIVNRGNLEFHHRSTAGDARITTHNGATTEFLDNSTAGAAELRTEGTVDFSGTSGVAGDGSVSAGSISGAGIYALGSNELTVGANNLSTEVTGTIRDGGEAGGSGASLVKTGSGALILSGTNTYTGATTVKKGVLQVDGSIAASSGVTVDNGGVLGGAGFAGAVTVKAGGAVAPGASAGMLSTGSIVFAAGSRLAIEIGGTTAGTQHDQLAVAGTVNLGGASLDAALIGGFNPGTTMATSFLIVDNDGGDVVSGAFAGLAQGAEFTIGKRLFVIDYRGGTGNDVVLTSAGARIVGTAGGDAVNGAAAPAGQHKATILRDVIDGKGGNDLLHGLGGNDTLLGGQGHDKLDGGSGNDLMKGGAGNDTYVIDSAGDRAIEAAGQGTDLVQSSISFSLGTHFENLTLTGAAAINGAGNNSANAIKGNGAGNILSGAGGSDMLIGGGGNDRLIGGPGKNALTGGTGADTFVFDSMLASRKVAKANADTITDFNPASDTIELSGAVFAMLSTGVLDQADFGIGKKKPAKDGHLVYYDRKNGTLWYDANGSKKGGKGDVMIAELAKNLALTHDDIVVA